LAELLSSLDRTVLQSWAHKARSLAKLDAVQQVVQACEELATPATPTRHGGAA
jgi:hypothetical protein